MRSRRRSKSTNSSSKWASALLAGLVLAVASGGALASPRSFEELMPEGPIVYLSASSLPELLERIRSAPGYKLLSEPEMQPFLDRFQEPLEAVKAEIGRVLGINLEELETIVGGQVCLGVLPRGDTDAHFLLLADVSGDSELAQTVLHNLLDYMREEQEEYLIKEESFRRHTVYCIEPIEQEPEAETPTGGRTAESGQDWEREWPLGGPERQARKENPGFITLSDGILALASSPDRSLLERHLVLREGGDVPSLAEMDSYKRLESYMGEDRHLTVFVDFARMLQRSDEVDEFGGGLGSVLGTQNVRALGLGVTMTEDGTAGQGLLLAPGPRGGLLRAFVPEGGDVMPPPYVDEGAGAFGGMHFSIPVLWEEWKAYMQREQPGVYTMFEQQRQAMPVDIENDVIKAFGSRWFIYVPGVAASGDAALPGMAVCVDLKNASALEGAWQQRQALFPIFIEFEPVDFMGVKIYQVKRPPDWPVEGAAASPCVAFLQDKLVYASSLALAKSIVKDGQRATSPLLGDAEFRRLLGRTMDDAHAVLFWDGRVLGRWMAERSERLAAGWRQLATGAQGVPEVAMPETLPWEVLEKYQTVSLLTCKWIEDGLLIRAWSPHPTPED